jgi:hypothetical protein
MKVGLGCVAEDGETTSEMDDWLLVGVREEVESILGSTF